MIIEYSDLKEWVVLPAFFVNTRIGLISARGYNILTYNKARHMSNSSEILAILEYMEKRSR